MRKAKEARDDEFYTTLQPTFLAELDVFADWLKGKTICCPCNDLDSVFPDELVKRGATVIAFGERNGVPRTRVCSTQLGNFEVDCETSDMRHLDVLRTMRSCDAVITNPPFSQVRWLVRELLASNVKFLLLAPTYVATATGILEYSARGDIATGNRVWRFQRPDGTTVDINNTHFITNITEVRQQHPLELKTKFSDKPRKFDTKGRLIVENYFDIPSDFDGIFTVSQNFIKAYCPSQFKILGTTEKEDSSFRRLVVSKK